MRRAYLIILASLLSPVAANAVVIDFNAIPLGAFGSAVEDGFSIAATNGRSWGPVWGFPDNSVGTQDGNQTATFSFTSGGLFTFDAFDLVNPGSGGIGPVTIEGYLGATLLASDLYALPGTANTPTSHLAANLAGLSIDRLDISVMSSTINSPLIDNVSLTALAVAVPEPMSLSLLGAGLFGFAFVRRQRRHPV